MGVGAKRTRDWGSGSGEADAVAVAVGMGTECARGRLSKFGVRRKVEWLPDELETREWLFWVR